DSGTLVQHMGLARFGPPEAGVEAARAAKSELPTPRPGPRRAVPFGRRRRGVAPPRRVGLERASPREPAKASIREALGIAYFRLRRYQEAESEFRAMVDLSPADDYAHYGLARALEKLGRTSEARGHLKLARSLRPGSEHYAARLRALE